MYFKYSKVFQRTGKPKVEFVMNYVDNCNPLSKYPMYFWCVQILMLNIHCERLRLDEKLEIIVSGNQNHCIANDQNHCIANNSLLVRGS